MHTKSEAQRAFTTGNKYAFATQDKSCPPSFTEDVFPNEKQQRRSDFRHKKKMSKLSAIAETKTSKKDRKLAKKIKPQGGLSDIKNMLLNPTRHIEDSLMNKAAPILERFASYFLSLSEVKTTKGALLCTHLFLTGFSDNASLVSIVTKYAQDIFVEPQGKGSNWLESLQDIHLDWTAMTTNPAFSKISKLMSMALTIGFFKGNKISYDIGALKIFSVEAMNKQVSACDFLDACGQQ